MLFLPLGGINRGVDKRRWVVIELFNEKELGDRIVISQYPPFTTSNVQRYYEDICMGLVLCRCPPPLHPFPPYKFPAD
jgi:hypothetical protein